MQLRRSLCVALILFISGCSAAIMPTMRGQIPADITNQSIVAASVVVLQENGFDVSVVDPTLGIVVTDWKTLTSPALEFAATIFSSALTGSRETYRERMRLSLTVDRGNHTFILKPLKQMVTSTYGWTNENLDKEELRSIEYIAAQIVLKAGGSAQTLKWDVRTKRKQEEAATKTGNAAFGAGCIIALVVIILAVCVQQSSVFSVGVSPTRERARAL